MAKKPKKEKCGARYTTRQVNGVWFYSFCSKRKGHLGGHGKGWF